MSLYGKIINFSQALHHLALISTFKVRSSDTSWKIVSPVKIASFVRNRTDPGVCPGVSITVISVPAITSSCPSSIVFYILKCPDCRELLSHIILRKTLRNILCICNTPESLSIVPAASVPQEYDRNDHVSEELLPDRSAFPPGWRSAFRIICRINEKSLFPVPVLLQYNSL